jgi:hypothetical protein
MPHVGRLRRDDLGQDAASQPGSSGVSWGFDPSSGKGTAEIAGDITYGTVDGLANLAVDAARIDLLHVPAGLAHLVGSAWQGGGGVSGLAAIFWEPGRAQVAAAAEQAADGDFRGAAASTVKAVSTLKSPRRSGRSCNSSRGAMVRL